MKINEITQHIELKEAPYGAGAKVKNLAGRLNPFSSNSRKMARGEKQVGDDANSMRNQLATWQGRTNNKKGLTIELFDKFLVTVGLGGASMKPDLDKIRAGNKPAEPGTVVTGVKPIPTNPPTVTAPSRPVAAPTTQMASKNNNAGNKQIVSELFGFDGQKDPNLLTNPEIDKLLMLAVNQGAGGVETNTVKSAVAGGRAQATVAPGAAVGLAGPGPRPTQAFDIKSLSNDQLQDELDLRYPGG